MHGGRHLLQCLYHTPTRVPMTQSSSVAQPWPSKLLSQTADRSSEHRHATTTLANKFTRVGLTCSLSKVRSWISLTLSDFAHTRSSHAQLNLTRPQPFLTNSHVKAWHVHCLSIVEDQVTDNSTSYVSLKNTNSYTKLQVTRIIQQHVFGKSKSSTIYQKNIHTIKITIYPHQSQEMTMNTPFFFAMSAEILAPPTKFLYLKKDRWNPLGKLNTFVQHAESLWHLLFPSLSAWDLDVRLVPGHRTT